MKGLWLSKKLIARKKKVQFSIIGHENGMLQKQMDHRRPSSHKTGLVPTLG
jgi:hypothetical protein